MSVYSRVFRLTLGLFILFFAIFLVLFYFVLTVPFSNIISQPRGLAIYGLVVFTGFISAVAMFRLVQLHRQHERFKNTGYDYPYPKEVEERPHEPQFRTEKVRSYKQSSENSVRYVARNIILIEAIALVLFAGEGFVIISVFEHYFSASETELLQLIVLGILGLTYCVMYLLTTKVWHFAKIEFYDDFARVHLGRSGEVRDIPYADIEVSNSFSLNPSPRGFWVGMYVRICDKKNTSSSWTIYNGTIKDEGERYQIGPWIYIKWRRATGDLKS